MLNNMLILFQVCQQILLVDCFIRVYSHLGDATSTGYTSVKEWIEMHVLHVIRQLRYAYIDKFAFLTSVILVSTRGVRMSNFD